MLWCGESTFLNTGYATYANEVMKRLKATGKYELMELGCYGPHNDPRGNSVPWLYVSNMPDPGNQAEVDQYNSSPTNQFGEWKFEEVCLYFKPDIVIDVRDWWMFEYQERSPFRPLFHQCLMPTVDAYPQDKQWLATFQGADAVFTYSDWGMAVLQEQTRGRINGIASAPPGADLENLKPVANRQDHRKKLGVDPDCFLVGTVMRNQKRKLYPDLIQAFKKFISLDKDVASKAFLYLHTSYPDVGWDIPRLLMEEGIASKVVMTYCCRQCQSWFPSFFADAKTTCKRCGNPSATLPNSMMGISREALGDVINLFDVYVQYANSEGFGMPQVEAAACGVPVMAVDYSAMKDVVRKLKGYPIPVERLSRESETHCWRALPSNDEFVKILYDFYRLPSSVREKKGYDARKAVLEHYTYDKTAAVWDAYLDTVAVKDGVWEQPFRGKQPNMNVPEGMSNEEFVKWGIVNMAGRPELLNSYMAMRMARDLNWGITTQGTGGIYFNDASTLGFQTRQMQFERDQAIGELVKLNRQLNYWESRRVNN